MKSLRNSKICITGIGGFIGRRLAEILKNQGAIVSGIEKNPDTAEELNALGFDVHIGSTSDAVLLEKVLRGIDSVVHTAAIVREGGDFEEFREVNVHSTLLLAKLSRTNGVRAFVHLSSVMVYGFDYEENIGEDGELKGEGNPYCTTKIEGEIALKELMDEKFGIIIIRPGDVYGKGSRPWVLRPLELMQLGLFSLPDGGTGRMNCTHVDNLCSGILLSIEKEAYGGVFNITDGDSVTWKEYFDRLAISGGFSPPPSLPAFLARILVDGVGFGFRILGKPSPVSGEGIDFILRKYPVSIEKARKELGYIPVIPMEEGLRTTFEWVGQIRKS